MDEELIYRKTKRGAAELTATHGALTSPARRVLILLDGQRTLAELAELFGAESVEHIVADLEAQGLVRQVDPDNELTTQALTTQSFPTLIGEPRLDPIEPPPSRRGSTWIALGLLVAALATAGGGYWFYVRPTRAPEPIFAAAGTSDVDRADAPSATQDRTIVDAPGPRELPLSGLPAVTVTQTKKAAATPEPAELADVEPAAAIVRAAASPEASAQARRQAERGTADRGASDRGSPVTPAAVLAAAQAALNTASPTDSGVAAAAAVQALTARPAAAAAQQPSSAPPSSAGESPSAAPEPAAAPAAAAPQATPEQAPPATVMTVGANPAALSNAGKAAPLGEQVASLAPPPRPQSAPVQLHQRKHDPPEFPIRAVRSKVFEGHVLARIWITPEGNVDQVDIVKATPPRLFDEEVKRALGAWTFDPPGRPVDTTVQLDFKP